MQTKILITYTKSVKGKLNFFGHSFTSRDAHSCEILILTDGEHFRCIKNRYDSPHKEELIPNSLLTAYLMRYESHFSKQELIDALVYETTS